MGSYERRIEGFEEWWRMFRGGSRKRGGKKEKMEDLERLVDFEVLIGEGGGGMERTSV